MVPLHSALCRWDNNATTMLRFKRCILSMLNLGGITTAEVLSLYILSVINCLPFADHIQRCRVNLPPTLHPDTGSYLPATLSYGLLMKRWSKAMCSMFWLVAAVRRLSVSLYHWNQRGYWSVVGKRSGLVWKHGCSFTNVVLLSALHHCFYAVSHPSFSIHPLHSTVLQYIL